MPLKESCRWRDALFLFLVPDEGEGAFVDAFVFFLGERDLAGFLANAPMPPSLDCLLN